MDGIAYQVDEYTGELWFGTYDLSPIKAHVGEGYVVPAVKEVYFFFKQLVEIDLHRFLGVEFRESRELIGGVSEQVYLLEYFF